MVDPFTDWRSAPPDVLAAEINRLWQMRQFTTLGIAALLGVREADVWNARVKADAGRSVP